jgi:glyoxylase-like metal-dependent hydrolase (beta-lactamase superfamily II)
MTLNADRFRVGQIDCLVVQDRSSTLSISYLLPAAGPKELKPQMGHYGLAPDTIDFSINLLLLDVHSHRVLIDTGLGESDLPEKLETLGVQPAEIDLIILTHGHRDHIGGVLDSTGQIQFPNARYLTMKAEYEYWTQPEQVGKITHPPALEAWKWLQAYPEKIDLIDALDDGIDIIPGITCVPAPGHTPGSMILRIDSEGERLWHIADTAHSVLQVPNPHWSSVFDMDKISAAATRQDLFEQVARDKAFVIAYHFPYPGLGHVAFLDGQFYWTPLDISDKLRVDEGGQDHSGH